MIGDKGSCELLMIGLHSQSIKSPLQFSLYSKMNLGITKILEGSIILKKESWPTNRIQ